MIDFLVGVGLTGLGIGTLAWMSFIVLCFGFTICCWAMLFYLKYIWRDTD